MMDNYYRHLQDLLMNQGKGWSVTVSNVVGSSPGSLGQKMLIQEDVEEISGTIGGGALEKRVIDYIRESKPKQFSQMSFTLQDQEELGMVCGGDIDLIIEPINVKERLIIFGAGHCALALSELASKLGFEVVIYDSRKEWANSSKFVNGENFIVNDFLNIHDKVSFLKSDYLVVMTYGHSFDYEVAKQLIDLEVKYLGIMGSKSKAKELISNLNQEFVEANVSKVHCPIGLSIHSHTPYEIAVSIIAQIIKVRNSG
ncbi:MAG: hypothetical protein B6226_05895 [Candidatus Cloacimonetes bacterium 4572_65]|nr:MAG: hypothetical protein B6226_05895 [Candidatus Cloacimonetes bacterium 4572_65]